MPFLVRWFVNAIALFIVIHLVAGVSADNWQAIIAAAFVLGLFNAFLRPLVVLLTLPINILSFGLFTLIINGSLFYLASKFVKGFIVVDFWSAFWAAILFSIISFILNTFINPAPGLTFRTNIYSSQSRRSRPRHYEDAIDVEARAEDDAEDIPDKKQGGRLEDSK